MNTRVHHVTPAIRRLVILLAALCTPCLAADAPPAPLKVASLNPVVADLARQVGGNAVEVIDLMPVDANPHSFYPSPDHLKQAAGSALVLAAGKGLEPYLAEFRESLGGNVPLLEVGNSVPSLILGDPHSHSTACCPDHAHGAADPHWWHSVRNARRASLAIAARLGELDPSRKTTFDEQARAYTKTLDELDTWIRAQLARVPREDRELATSHAAFSYLCREFGLRSITIQGLTTEEQPTPGYLKEVIGVLKTQQVRAVFPERNANPGVLASMVKEANVRLGGELHAGSLPSATPTYTAMMRTNITTIVEALRPKE